MFCPQCGAESSDVTCANCGAPVAALLTGGGTAAAPAPAYASMPMVATAAPVELPTRLLGVVIDWLPTLLIGVIAWIPVVGQLVGGLLLTAYWLLRDIKGASLGKQVLKLRVVMKDGSAPTSQALILRNITIAAQGIALMVPLLGLLLGAVVGFVMLVVEIVFLATRGERLGDSLAGTKVVRVG